MSIPSVGSKKEEPRSDLQTILNDERKEFNKHVEQFKKGHEELLKAQKAEHDDLMAKISQFNLDDPRFLELLNQLEKK